MSANRLLVSCTTTAERLDLLFYTLQSLKRQQLKPDGIYVHISSNPYLRDTGIDSIPDWLEEDDSVVVRWVDNIGPYRKLIPLINECTDNDRVVTADDDILYHPEWLLALCALHDDHSGYLVCARARHMRRSPVGGWQNYSRWDLVDTTRSGIDLLPTGGGGAVYQRALFDLDFLNDRSFLSVAPTADDLWFRMASLKKGVPVHVEPQINKQNWFIRHHFGLEEINIRKAGPGVIRKLSARTLGQVRAWIGVDASENDRAWRKIEQLAM